MKIYDLDYHYDIENDVACAKIKNDYKYIHSKESEGVIYDLDINGNIIGVEIHDASVVFDIEKKYLISPNIEIIINTTEDVIKIYITFDFKNNERKMLKDNILNKYSAQTGFKQLKK